MFSSTNVERNVCNIQHATALLLSSHLEMSVQMDLRAICILHTSPCRMWVGFTTFDFHRTPTSSAGDESWMKPHRLTEAMMILLVECDKLFRIYDPMDSGGGDYGFVPLVAL